MTDMKINDTEKQADKTLMLSESLTQCGDVEDFIALIAKAFAEGLQRGYDAARSVAGNSESARR